MDSNLCVDGCCSPQLPWAEHSVERQDQAGIGHARTRTRAAARKLRDQLKGMFARGPQPHGVWVAVQNRGENDPDAYWIGKVTEVMEEHKEMGSVPGTGGRERFDKGDLKLRVIWFQREAADMERRTFSVWTGACPDTEYSFNSSELRAIDFSDDMVPDRQLQLGNISSRVRMRRGVVASVHTVRAEPPGVKYVISCAQENAILCNCCP